MREQAVIRSDAGVQHARSLPLTGVLTEDTVSPKNLLNDLTGREWLVATKSVWFQKGLGANHPHARIEREHPAPYSFQDVIRLILFFSKSGARVLDPFAGVGSTLKACALSGRQGTGIELVGQWAELAKIRLVEEVGSQSIFAQEVIQGDSRQVLADVARFPDNSYDFVVTSPPYWGILNRKPDHKVRRERLSNGLATNYSDDGKDLANIADYEEFLDEVSKVFQQCWRVLKPGRYACIVVGDFRHKNRYIPYHADLAARLTESPLGEGFELKGIAILVQNNKRLYPYGYPYAYVPNMHHQYILVLAKPRTGRSGERDKPPKMRTRRHKTE